MNKILLTGMTAQQSSSNLAKRSVTFAGTVGEILRLSHYDVDHAYPGINMSRKDLDRYDRVIVGVSSLLSMSSHRAYGALRLISELADSDKLMYLVDSPEPEKIVISLKAIVKNIDDLFKPFYRSRADYAAVTQDKRLRKSVERGATILATDWSRKTLYPMTPFMSDQDAEALVSDDTRGVFRGISIDRYLISYDEFTLMLPSTRAQAWVTTNTKTKWYRSTSKTLGYDVEPLRYSKKETDLDVKNRISSRAGLLAGPHNNKTLWWSYPIIQAINTGTVVSSDWRITGSLGNSWSVLPSTVESMSTYEYIDLAKAQRDSYLGKIDSIQEMTSRLTNEVENPL